MPMQFGQEFSFNGEVVGCFFDERAPLSPGPRRYEPYRSNGHFEMHRALDEGETPRCRYVRDGERVEFTVNSSPRYGVLELADFAYFPPGHPGEPSTWEHPAPRPLASRKRGKDYRRRYPGADDGAARPPRQPSDVALAGFRLDPGSERADLYAVVRFFADGEDRPILVDGRLAFVTEPERVRNVLDRCDPEVRSIAKNPGRIAVECDVAGSLYRIQCEDGDEDAMVADSLFALLDLLRGAGVDRPAGPWSRLGSFVDDAASRGEFRSWFDSHRTPRRDVLDAVAWCVGKVAMLTRFY
ncbi:hypothetical protein [Paludisphaera soli]|uniref:hypothetical protein n=1 Tax=Paludisphaera soli TaxID=2712865 RepID=UPI0013EBEE5E|nr:hypothetical protein [Paludisphaera soli]